MKEAGFKKRETIRRNPQKSRQVQAPEDNGRGYRAEKYLGISNDKIQQRVKCRHDGEKSDQDTFKAFDLRASNWGVGGLEVYLETGFR